MPSIQERARPTPAQLPELFQAYQGLVFRTAYLLLGTREEAEDALQEVFLAVYRSLGTYDPARGAVSTWLYRITVNHCKRQQARLRWRLPAVRAEPDELAQPGMEAFERDQVLLQVLARLPADLRALVVLRYGWELPFAEMAAILGIPLGTVKSRHTQALNRLRQLYASRPLDLQED